MLDWVYPPECAVCGEPGDRLCKNCLNQIRFSNDQIKDDKGYIQQQDDEQGILSRNLNVLKMVLSWERT